MDDLIITINDEALIQHYQLKNSPNVAIIMGAIPDFAYTFSKGFLHWEFKRGLDKGTLRYSCETEEFQRFQELIKLNSPTSFEELEGFLL